MKLPEVLIWGDWACRNIAGLECADPNNWYVLAARTQEYVCVRARALSRMTLRYEYKRLGLTGFVIAQLLPLGTGGGKTRV
jgi:hypothetical protein